MANEEQQLQNQANFVEQMLREAIKAEDVIRRYNDVKIARQPWDALWQKIQDQVFPEYRNFRSPGKKSSSAAPQTGSIKNHSSAVSGKINKVVSLLSSQLNDPAAKWLHLKFGSEELEENPVADAWLKDCTEKLYRLFADPMSNFYPSTYSLHLDWFTLGTSCREVALRSDNGQIQFNTISMQNIYIDLSGYGDIDTVYRSMFVTPKQAFDLWGERIHPFHQQLLENSRNSGNSTLLFEYIEVVLPNPLQALFPSLDNVSIVIDIANKHAVAYNMHHSSPYIVSRFYVTPGETYGRSYVWNGMQDILAINRLSKRVLQGIDFATMPVNLVQNASSIVQAQITPGAFIQGLDSRGNPMIQPMALGSGNVPMAMDFYIRKIQELDDTLVISDVVPPESPNMTATEVNERKIQASNRIRPLLVRLEGEDLGKTILRTLALMQQTGRLTPFPYQALNMTEEELPDPLRQLRVSFSGQMAKMQRMQEIVNNDMIFQKTVAAAQVDPSVLDRINLDQLIVQDAEVYDIAPGVMNTNEQVQEIREARRQQQAAQMQAQQAAMAVDNYTKLTEAGVDVSQLQG